MELVDMRRLERRAFGFGSSSLPLPTIKGVRDMEIMGDFPKLHCPFIRKTFRVNKEDFKKYGSKLKLRTPEVYLAVDEINPGYEWVFEDKDTFAVEKLDGTNVKINMSSGRILGLQNRMNVIDPLQLMKGKEFIVEGVLMGNAKGFIEADGKQVGEVVGPKLQGNPYDLSMHLWYPFSKSMTSLRYKSFHQHDRTYKNWEAWFKDYLKSIFYMKTHKCVMSESIFAEGIIIYNLRRKEEGKTYMAKLRRNMFPFFYDAKIEIYY